jgi:cobalt-zinc-cadmium efflux system membrane fusion protein
MKRVLLFAFALLAACAKHEAHDEARPPDGQVWLSPEQLRNGHMEVAPVEERPVAGEITAPGRIAFDDSRVAHVFSPVSGRILRIHAQLGDRVRKGAALVTLDAPDAGGAAADAGKAQVDVTAAERELARQRYLYKAHASARKDLDTAQAARDRAAAELARARERVRLLRGRGAAGSGQEFTLRSPIDGEVIARNVAPGMEIAGQAAGGTSAELFTVGDIDRVWAVADVFEMDLPKIRAGAAVSVRVVAWPDQVFPGRVDWISKVLDPGSRSVRIRAVLDNPGHELLPEMTASVAITMPAPMALALPRSALLRLGDQTVVLVQTGTTENGLFRFEERRVRVESDDADPVVVLSGLGRGEQVVVSGSLLVSGML